VFNAHGIETSIVAAVSEPEHAHLALEFGGIPAEVPNRPLGNKWNFAWRTAHKEEPDYLFIIGSDDFFADQLIERYIPHMKAGKPYIGIYDMYFCEPASKRAALFTGYDTDHSLYGTPLGTGRMIARGLLPRHPWPWHAEIGLDGDITTKLWDKPRVMIPVSATAPAIDVKTETNMWSYDKLQQSYKGAGFVPADCDTILRALPEGEEILATFGA
jgi:hypothetical protein